MNRLAFAACLLGFGSVALGAFGAHALDGQLTAQAEEWWQKATLYGLTHAAAALGVALASRSGRMIAGGGLMVAGAVIFGATLYAMALGAPRWLGAVTPVGGLGMLAGWALIALASLRSDARS